MSLEKSLSSVVASIAIASMPKPIKSCENIRMVSPSKVAELILFRPTIGSKSMSFDSSLATVLEL